jgi:hypothetical protein
MAFLRQGVGAKCTEQPGSGHMFFDWRVRHGERVHRRPYSTKESHHPDTKNEFKLQLKDSPGAVMNCGRKASRSSMKLQGKVIT